MYCISMQPWGGLLGLVALALALAAAAARAYCGWRLSYWRRRGVAQLPRAHWLWGHYRAGLLLRAPPAWLLAELYRAAPTEPVVGFYIFHKPCLLLRDPRLVRRILVTDFDAFADRNFAGAELRDSFGMINLFGLRGPAWRYVRRRMAPALSPARMRDAVPAMLAAARPLLAHAARAAAAAARRPLDAQDLGHRYAADLIARVALGTRTDSFAAPDAYTDNALEFFSGMRRMVALLVVFFVPWLPRLAARLRAPLYFEFREARRLFLRALQQRQDKAPAAQPEGDFIDHLMLLKDGPQNPLFEFSGENLLYQTGTFFSGFESSAVAGTFLLRALARRPALAARARAEVRGAVRGAGWGAAALAAMPQLARALKEALRMHPPVASLDRRAGEDYRIPGTDITIEKGIAVYISLSGLQSDPKYFPEPDKFDPERFAPGRPVPDAYLPFGRGPRMCPSARGGELHVLLLLATILYHFELSEPDTAPDRAPDAPDRAPDAPDAPDAAASLDPRSTFTAVAGGLPILFRKLDTSMEPSEMVLI